MITHNGKTYKVAITTPAGREEFLSIFKHFIYRKMEEGLVDSWQLWQNTVKQSDIDYLASMEAENPKVKRYFIENIENKWNNCDTLRTCEFFSNAHDDDTIYVRFDDDIVWCAEDAIEKMAIARIEHPDAFAIYPNVINSTVCSAWHQEIGAISKEAGELRHETDSQDPDYIYLDEFAYTDSKFIDLIHDTFKKRFEENSLEAYYLPSRSFNNYQRFSICSLAWWGKDKIVPSTLEEPQMSWQLPEQLKRPIYFVGDALCVHYSYHTQIDYLNSCTPQKLDFYKLITK